jgi:dihydrofolate synthase/folylpolyglutamate synthase
VADPLPYFFGLEQFGIKFGLDNISSIVERLGHPQQAFRAVHVAGTNGKGSVAAMVDAALRAAGHRVGRYTSPHLIDLSERFVIDGRRVGDRTLNEVAAHVKQAIESLREDGSLPAPPTFFEATTALAFELFRRASIDVAVLEVGLGGRLDATNVVVPAVAAITSIDLDHQLYLGPTLRHIAIEKAGIIKPGVPVIVGPMAGEPFHAIDDMARSRNAMLIRALDGVTVGPAERLEPHGSSRPTIGAALASGIDRPNLVQLRTPCHDYGALALGLRGAHQTVNAVVAARILEALHGRGVPVPAAAIATGLEQPDWPGRLDVRRLPDGREALLDAAHNPAGATALASYLHECSVTGLPLVLAIMRDKDIEGILRALLPSVGTVVLTRASTSRSADPGLLEAVVKKIDPARPTCVAGNAAGALDAAWRRSGRIVVAGSIFLLGDVMKEITATI